MPPAAAPDAPTARGDPRQLLDVVGRLNALDDTQALLDALAEASARTAGYRVALISLGLPQGCLFGAYNLSSAEVRRFREEAESSPPERRVAKRRRIRDMAYPGTGISYAPHDCGLPYGGAFRETARPRAGSWHPRDRLFIVMRASGGRDVGVASFDDPEDGEAPREDALEPLRLAEQLLEIGASFVEARLLQAGLRESEDRWRRLVDGSPDAIVLHGGGRVVFANRAAHALLAETSVLGRAALDFVHADDREEVRRRMEAVAAGERTALKQWRLLRADGSVVHVESTATPTEYGGRAAVQVILRDVTERLRLEADARKAQKMEAVGRLAGGVAHEYNNVLTAVVGFGQLLDERCQPDPVAKGYSQRILAAADRAAAVTRQLLAFGRRQVARPVVVDVNALARQQEDAARRAAGPKVELELRLAAEPVRVLADTRLLGQVLMNLVLNAADAMPDGGRLVVECGAAEPVAAWSDLGRPPERWALVTVTDTGPGLDEEARARVFEPFVTSKRGAKGTGLDLATASDIVEQAGGRIVCRSELGRGTSFEVWLPCVETASDDGAASRPYHVAAQRCRTILVADDEEAIRSYVRAVLGAEGHHVLVAADGQEALDASDAHTGTIDLLLTDVGMPRMDGLELARRFAEARPQAHVLFMSGYVGASEGGSLVLPEGAAYLPKPFGPPELLAKVGQVFAGVRSTAVR